MWDKANGGCYTAVAPTPHGLTDGTKQLVGHAHALSAPSEYALAVPSPELWACPIGRVFPGDRRRAEIRRRWQARAIYVAGDYVAGDPDQPADDLHKLGFAQAEALLGTCDSWVRTGNDRHQEAFRRTLRWILRDQADWARGDWHPSISPGYPGTTKALPFHPGRAVLYSLELLDGRPGDRG